MYEFSTLIGAKRNMPAHARRIPYAQRERHARSWQSCAN